MNRDTVRMAIGFAVIVAILIAWQLMFRPEARRQAAPVVAVDTLVQSDGPVAVPAEHVASGVPVLFSSATPPETSVVIENELLRVTFSSVGGAISSAYLKRDHADLVPSNGLIFTPGLVTERGHLDLARTPFHVRVDSGRVTLTAGDDSIGMTRTFTLDQGHTIRLEVKTRGAIAHTIGCPVGLAVTESNSKEDLSHFHFYSRSGNKTRTLSARSLKHPVSDTSRIRWVALKTKYFFVAAFDTSRDIDAARIEATPDDRISFEARAENDSGTLTLYVGPLEYNELRSFGLGFEDAVSLGWAKPISIAILWLLELLYRIFKNWGIAIIIFAIIMKAAFYPLTRSQTAQMRRMQQLQPKLSELKKKHKDDAQALNQETMQLYKLYKINPLSGCLPMLVQLPVFWALYSVLRSHIELRGAGFILWLKDLSQPDALFGHLPFFGNPPIGLLPILMGVSFIAQNLLTSADKKNWAMTIIFPVFITVIFLNFPSGLQLYWFMYNVLSIVESLIGLKGGARWIKKSPAAVAPAPTGRI